MTRIPTQTTKLYGGEVTIDFYESNHAYHITDQKRRVNNKRLKGVTTYTGVIDKSAPLMYWAVDCCVTYLAKIIDGGGTVTIKDTEDARWIHRRKKDEAADLGSQVHLLAEEYIKAKLARKKIPTVRGDELDEQVYNGYIAFLDWVHEQGVKFVSTEQMVYSRRHKYPGLCDVIFTLKREKHKIIHVGDFKTGKPKTHKKQRKGKWEIIGVTPYPEHRYQVSSYQEAESEESGTEYGNKWIMYFGKDNAEFTAFEIPAEEHKADYQTFLACMKIKNRGQELDL